MQSTSAVLKDLTSLTQISSSRSHLAFIPFLKAQISRFIQARRKNGAGERMGFRQADQG